MRGWLIAVAMTGALTACSGGGSEQELLRDAKLALDQRQFPTASIQLKTLLQKNPSSAEARFLLGRVLLESGDAVGADT